MRPARASLGQPVVDVTAAEAMAAAKAVRIEAVNVERFCALTIAKPER